MRKWWITLSHQNFLYKPREIKFVTADKLHDLSGANHLDIEVFNIQIGNVRIHVGSEQQLYFEAG